MGDLVTITNARRRTLPARDALERFVGRAVPAQGRQRGGRQRGRDSRGRFVAFPTSLAPSWYVLCAGAYRIPVEEAPPTPPAIAPVAQQPPPCATARRRGQRVTRSELETLFLVLIVVVVSAWFAFHLPPPR